MSLSKLFPGRRRRPDGYIGREDAGQSVPSMMDEEEDAVEADQFATPNGTLSTSWAASVVGSVETRDSRPPSGASAQDPIMSTFRESTPAVLDVGRSQPLEPFGAVLSDIVPPEMVSVKWSQAAPKYDEFGFEMDEEDSCIAVMMNISQQQFEEPGLRLRWQAYLEFTHNRDVAEFSWDKLADHLPHEDKLLELVRCGVPHHMRPQLWPRLAGARVAQQKCSVSYKDLLRRSAENSGLTVSRQIEKDILRTMPQNGCFSTKSCPGVKRLRNILRCLAELFPEIGYCQGTGMVVASLLLLLDEETAFWMMATIVKNLLAKDYYSCSLLGAQTDQLVFRHLVRTHLPHIEECLQRNQIDLSLITLHWFMTCFASVLPFHVLLRVWDLFFYEGSIVLFRIALAMLRLKEDDFAPLNSVSDIFTMLTNLPAEMVDPQVLVTIGYDLTPQFTDVALTAHRQVHRAELSDRLADLSSTETEPPYLRSPGSAPTTPLSTSNSFFGLRHRNGRHKPKNVMQTELILALRDAIRDVVQHFRTNCGIPEIPVDYSMGSHMQDYVNYAQSYRSHRRRRARALVDFQRHDADELGFRRNDIITLISQKDEHCWVGELNGLRGWFPAKFVEVLDERSKLYAAAGDDSVSDTIAHLMRGVFCSSLRAIFEHGLRVPRLFGSIVHPWLFIEEASRSEVSKDFQSVYSRLILSKTFSLENDGKILTPEEMLYRSMEAVNLSHDTVSAPMDVKFRSLVCAGLNEQALHLWFETLCSSREVIEKWYEPWSYIRSPGWVQIKCELRLLAVYSFKLSLDWEIAGSPQVAQPLKESVRDMLIKHHLFSWDL